MTNPTDFTSRVPSHERVRPSRSLRVIPFLALLASCSQDAKLDRDDHLRTLKEYGEYGNADTVGIAFQYAEPSDANLALLRSTYHLDDVAGSGDELEQVLNLMRWVHATVPHAGSAANPSPPNALHILQTGAAVNCRMMSTVLNEVYLAMGFPSRILVCMPEAYPTNDCHVVNMVFLRGRNRWVLMDASFELYFLDDAGSVLGPEEIRSRYVADLPIWTNPEVNHNGRANREWAETYMIKKLVWFNSPVRHGFNSEGSPGVEYAALVPENYALPSPGTNWTVVSTPALFWQAPSSNAGADRPVEP